MGRYRHISFELLLVFTTLNSFLMLFAQEAADYRPHFRYGEPTVLVIERVKNTANDRTLSRRTEVWGPTAQFEPRYPPPCTTVILLVLICLILCTVFGNGLVVAAVFLERSLQRFSNYLIVSLAVADLMVALLVMPISALDAVSTRWFLGLSICDFWIVMDVLCCTASILHLVAIAIDRYWAVTRADYSRSNNKKIICGMIFAVWLASISISLPSRFTATETSNLIAQVLNGGLCVINTNKVYTVFSTVGAFFLPTTFLLFIYIKIYFSALRRIRRNKFKWLKYPSSVTNIMKTCESIVTLTKAAAASAAPPSPITPLASGMGLDIKQKVFSTNTDLSQYCVKNARLSSPTMWVDDDDDVGADADADANYPFYDFTNSPCASPKPIDIPPIQSPFVPQTPLSTPHRAFALSQLSPSSQSSPPPGSNGCSTNDRQLNGNKRKHDLETGISYSFISVKKRFVDKHFSLAAVETVVERRERLEHRREGRAARTLAIITSCFLLCWIPFSVNALVHPFCTKTFSLPEAGEKFLLWLGYLNSLLNPIIYTIFSPDYRKAFIKILTGKYCRGKGRS